MYGILNLLVTFANSLDKDQNRLSVWHSDSVPGRIFWKRLLLKKASRRQQKHEKLPNMQRVNRWLLYWASIQQTVQVGMCAQWGIQRGFRGFARTLLPVARFKISYGNEIIWSHWDQIISFSWDIQEKWDQISKANPHTIIQYIRTPFPKMGLRVTG